MSILDIFKKDKGVIVPPAPQSLDDMKKQMVEQELKAKVAKLNQMAIESGVLFCCRCRKVSGLYKLTLKRHVVPGDNGDQRKVYICNYCEGIKQ